MLLENSNIKLSIPRLSDLLENLEDRFTDYFNVRGLGVNAAKADFLHLQFKLKWLKTLNDEAQKKVDHLVTSLMSHEQTDVEIPEEAEDPYYNFEFLKKIMTQIKLR
ncbi:hypothetical protein TKK_0008482 [Trichogramma kaykai]